MQQVPCAPAKLYSAGRRSARVNGSSNGCGGEIRSSRDDDTTVSTSRRPTVFGKSPYLKELRRPSSGAAKRSPLPSCVPASAFPSLRKLGRQTVNFGGCPSPTTAAAAATDSSLEAKAVGQQQQWEEVEVLGQDMSLAAQQQQQPACGGGGGGDLLPPLCVEGNRTALLVGPLALAAALAFVECCYSTSLLLDFAGGWAVKCFLLATSAALSSVFYYLVPWEAFKQSVVGGGGGQPPPPEETIKPLSLLVDATADTLVEGADKTSTFCERVCGKNFFSNLGLLYLGIMNSVLLAVLLTLATFWPKNRSQFSHPKRVEGFYETPTGKASLVVGLPLLCLLTYNALQSEACRSCTDTVNRATASASAASAGKRSGSGSAAPGKNATKPNAKKPAGKKGSGIVVEVKT